MPLEEDRITNLLYLVNQIKSITISDKTSFEKQRTITQMAQIGLFKHTGDNIYVLDTLGQQIVDSRRSYTQYLEFLASNKSSNASDSGSNQPPNTYIRSAKFVKTIIAILSLIAFGILTYLFFFNDNG